MPGSPAIGAGRQRVVVDAVLVGIEHRRVLHGVVVAHQHARRDARVVADPREVHLLDALVGVSVAGGVEVTRDLTGQDDQPGVRVAVEPVVQHVPGADLAVATAQLAVGTRIDQQHVVDAAADLADSLDSAEPARAPARDGRDRSDGVGVEGRRVAGVVGAVAPDPRLLRDVEGRVAGQVLSLAERRVVDRTPRVRYRGHDDRRVAIRVTLGLVGSGLVRLVRRVEVAVRHPAGLAGGVVVGHVHLVPAAVGVRADGLTVHATDQLDARAVQHVAVRDAVDLGHRCAVAQVQALDVELVVLVGVDDVEDQAGASESGRRSDRAQANSGQGERERRHQQTTGAGQVTHLRVVKSADGLTYRRHFSISCNIRLMYASLCFDGYAYNPLK